MSKKLTKEITDLQQEVTDAMSNTTRGKAQITEENSSSVPTEPPTKVKCCNVDKIEYKSVKSKGNKNSRIPKFGPDNTESGEKEPNRIKQVNLIERPLLKLHNIQARVMPTHPFETAQQFEDWHDILKENKELCEKLKEELIQGCPVEPHKYIRNVWRSIFKNEAADCYSYTAKGRSKRRAIKKYLFTNIFQESFLKRFPGMDDIFFIDNTMRFFIYEHNVMSKSLRNKQKLQTGTEPRVQNEAFTDDEMEEQIFHDDEDSIL
uniref:DUF4806 domain-containing protein n=2 Tax=Ceratitis capitata TaxID=7213 RepID=W8C333_CERCA